MTIQSEVDAQHLSKKRLKFLMDQEKKKMKKYSNVRYTGTPGRGWYFIYLK